MTNNIGKILVTGAIGQIGTELTLALRKRYGNNNVIATDLRPMEDSSLAESGPVDTLDVMDSKAIDTLVTNNDIDTIVHLAAILSAVGEKKPQLAWQVNVTGMINVLEVAKDRKLNQVMVPSSIAVFGPGTPLEDTPNDTVLRPTTMYGVTKVAGELVGNYYADKLGLDVRGLRYPGIISAGALPGGGTTDYAVAIFHEAIKTGKYECFVKETTRLPMMFMPDCIKATMDLMAADEGKLKHRCDFNVGSMSFTVGELAAEIRKHLPGFECIYKPDYRQDIADSWPQSVDDSVARKEWGWDPEYNLASMTKAMLDALTLKYKK